jgi:acetolactate synthase-1/2/3 large subunit
MKVYAAIANAFAREGTTTIFGLLGDGNMNWAAAMAKYPQVKNVDARDEGAALGMAEGWARATGRVGVCSVTHGPGITRMMTSLVSVTRCRIPVVICTSATELNNDLINQAIDQKPLVTATGAGYVQVLKPAYAETAVRQAFHMARTELRPVVLAIPLDVQKMECDADGADYEPSSTLFAGQQQIRPAVDRLDAALKIISESRKCVVIAGRGAVKAGAVDACARLAQRLGALTATSLLAKGAFGDAEFHAGIAGMFSTRTVMQLFEEADCAIAVGASLNPHTIEGGYLFPQGKIIHIDAEPQIVMGNGRAADCYVQGDAAITVQLIEERLAAAGVAREGYRTAAVKKALAVADRDPAEYDIEAGTVDPREACRIVDERLPAEVGIAIGLGHAFAFPVMVMKKARPFQIYANGFGSIGQTFATAIGAAVALDGKPFVAIEGDGGAMQNIQELDTLRRTRARLLFIIMNDQSLGAEYHKLKAAKLDPALANVESPDFAAVARGFGVRGCTATTLDEVAAGIDEFLAGDGPMVLDMRISRNVLNITYRRMFYGEDV